MIAETIDDKASVWIASSDVTMVGMPKAESYCLYPNKNGYWSPLDFNGKFDSQATPAIQAMRTFLRYDFQPGG
jgi:hypothetical protein